MTIIIVSWYFFWISAEVQHYTYEYTGMCHFGKVLVIHVHLQGLLDHEIVIISCCVLSCCSAERYAYTIKVGGLGNPSIFRV